MPQRLRLIHENAADRATVLASSTAGGLSTANLKTDKKAQVWRSVGTLATLTLRWPNGAPSCGAIALPFSNLSGEATMQVRAFTLESDAEPLVDTGPVLCCPSIPLEETDWGVEPLGVNAFAYGMHSCASVWYELSVCARVEVTISDPANEHGYIEASRLVAGAPWSPQHNPTYGARWSLVDGAQVERSEAGDRHADMGPRHRRLTVDLARLPRDDRRRIMALARAGGVARPFFLSVFPGRRETDPTGEQEFQLWGALPPGGLEVVHPTFENYSAQLVVEEM